MCRNGVVDCLVSTVRVHTHVHHRSISQFSLLRVANQKLWLLWVKICALLSYYSLCVSQSGWESHLKLHRFVLLWSNVCIRSCCYDPPMPFLFAQIILVYLLDKLPQNRRKRRREQERFTYQFDPFLAISAKTRFSTYCHAPLPDSNRAKFCHAARA